MKSWRTIHSTTGKWIISPIMNVQPQAHKLVWASQQPHVRRHQHQRHLQQQLTVPHCTFTKEQNHLHPRGLYPPCVLPMAPGGNEFFPKHNNQCEHHSSRMCAHASINGTYSSSPQFPHLHFQQRIKPPAHTRLVSALRCVHGSRWGQWNLAKPTAGLDSPWAAQWRKVVADVGFTWGRPVAARTSTRSAMHRAASQSGGTLFDTIPAFKGGYVAFSFASLLVTFFSYCPLLLFILQQTYGFAKRLAYEETA